VFELEGEVVERVDDMSGGAPESWAGPVSGLTPGQCEIARLRLVEAEERKWKHGRGVAGSLVTHGQLVHNFDWNELCSEAGLEPPTTSQHARVPQEDAVEMFLVEMGYLPSGIRTLARFAKDKGFGLGYRRGGTIQTDIGPALEEVRRRWAARPLVPADASEAGRRAAVARDSVRCRRDSCPRYAENAVDVGRVRSKPRDRHL
jgi:hypothetical protein